MSANRGTASAARARLCARLRGGVPAGLLATGMMDAAMTGAGVLGGRAFRTDRLAPGLIGRWAAGFPHGRWTHADIKAAPPVRCEAALGLAAHYAFGVFLAELYLLPPRSSAPRLRWAVAYGLGTSVLPLFWLFPSLGYGPCASRSGEAGRLIRPMFFAHLAFGLGIELGERWFVRRDAQRGAGPARQPPKIRASSYAAVSSSWS